MKNTSVNETKVTFMTREVEIIHYLGRLHLFRFYLQRKYKINPSYSFKRSWQCNFVTISADCAAQSLRNFLPFLIFVFTGKRLWRHTMKSAKRNTTELNMLAKNFVKTFGKSMALAENQLNQWTHPIWHYRWVAFLKKNLESL